MEIKNNNISLNPYATLEQNTAVKGKARTAEGEAAAQAAGDRVSLSPEARLRTETYSAAMNAEDVRAAKVAALKAQVESGAYTPDSQAIAGAMLREEPGLFRP